MMITITDRNQITLERGEVVIRNSTGNIMKINLNLLYSSPSMSSYEERTMPFVSMSKKRYIVPIHPERFVPNMNQANGRVYRRITHQDQIADRIAQQYLEVRQQARDRLEQQDNEIDFEARNRYYRGLLLMMYFEHRHMRGFNQMNNTPVVEIDEIYNLDQD